MDDTGDVHEACYPRVHAHEQSVGSVLSTYAVSFWSSDLSSMQITLLDDHDGNLALKTAVPLQLPMQCDPPLAVPGRASAAGGVAASDGEQPE